MVKDKRGSIMDGRAVIVSLAALSQASREAAQVAVELLGALQRLSDKNNEMLSQWKDENVKKYLASCDDYNDSVCKIAKHFHDMEEYCNEQHATISRYLEI
jgi:uncharacterized protein YukE